jgi:exonuclease III
MANENLSIVCWNVRGLNAEARRSTVRETLSTTPCHIACLQETKLHLLEVRVAEFLGGPRLASFSFLLAAGPSGKRGGILLLWNDTLVDAEHIHVGTFSISAEVTI